MLPKSIQLPLPIIFFFTCFIFSFLLSLSMLDNSALAVQRTIVIDANKQFEYAEHNYQGKDYTQAIVEFNRFIHFFPDDLRVEKAQYTIGMSYFKLNRFRKAATTFQNLINVYEDTPIAVDAYFQMYNSYLKLQKSGQALLTLRNLITMSTDQQIIDEAYYQMGWTYLDLANWEKARLSFNQIHPQNQKQYHLKKIETELDKEKLLLRKNPNLAGALSVFPGAGYFYCHRYKDAFIAFLLNSAVALAAYESFDNENYALGGLLSMVGLGFYGGSIFGSVASAHKYNQSQTRQFIENMKRNLRIGFVGSSQNKGLALSVRYLF